ncbi:ANTAR domain-containing protein [Corticibacter populi]|uniref:ANTAR domain-containing protein n=1 Tax=Corticibacter populi TaxID=1550736 RepID=A0A3M6R1Q5_9BURK|nr:nitrate regulatory protein [Corticibacter populi]RMX08692.1 ANTAR domain-containing protein [Corticibacter populi]RZS36036.1 ANTAR domain-containing protein [Corticibacter populi]
MKSGLNFLAAARQYEIEELEQFADSSGLAHVIGQLVHELQRERGASNVFLASQGTLFAEQRRQLVQASDGCIRATRDFLERLEPQPGFPGSRARLFSCIAHAVHGLDTLPPLRRRIEALDISAPELIGAYNQRIAHLLAVVFEAADSATDPDLSRLLVAYFNLMQGKENAGQERAAGAAILGYGHATTSQQQQMLDLIDGQERCLRVFVHFAAPAAQQRWQDLQSSDNTAELERLRRIICTTLVPGKGAPPGASASSLSMIWYECCTRRIDAMKEVEDLLAGQLASLCRQKIDQARQELARYAHMLQALSQQWPATAPVALPASAAAAAPAPEHSLPQAGTTASAQSDQTLLAALFDGSSAPLGSGPQAQATRQLHGYGPHIERAIMDIMHEQSERLQSMADELSKAREALHERKLIERAKGLLMAHRQLTEEAAYRAMRQMAMEQNRRLIDVAQSVLSLESYLSR